MSDAYIPKEKLTAYERWEMAAFDEAERMAKAMQEAASAGTAEPPPAVAEPPAAPAIDPAELAALREQAFAEGRAAGYAAGLADGQRDGYASGEARAQAEIARLAALASEFSQALESSEAQLADELLALALDIAQQVLRTSLRVKPELIVPVVRDAIAALTNPHGHPALTLNPADAALVRAQLGEQLAHTGWRVLEDPQIAAGGCRIDNSGAEIDATLPTRWKRVVEALGRHNDWLDGQ
jgi:flagellar assembly protein FliH